jgi:hypothetical protein
MAKYTTQQALRSTISQLTNQIYQSTSGAIGGIGALKNIELSEKKMETATLGMISNI